jgi:chromosome segregation ATPase
MSSDVVQKLLKQGVVLLKHTESLTAELDKEKAEQLNLKEKYIEDMKQLEEQNKEIQLTFKNKINELTDNYLKMVSEKENLEQMYVEVKSAETQLNELLDNIKEYQKVAEENTKEKEILKKKYSDLKKQYEELLEKKTKLGFTIRNIRLMSLIPHKFR